MKPIPAPRTDPPSSCCSDPRSDETLLCPECSTSGEPVDLITVKALLKSSALRRLESERYRFCPAPDCDVVYFDSSTRSRFHKADLLVRVGQKESDDPIPVCYCFDFTLADLRRDVLSHGDSRIPAVIAEEIRAGHCACEVKNPAGSCCLGEVREAVKRIRSDMSKTSPDDSRG